MEFDRLKPWLTLDQWQKDYIAEEGDCLLVCGRQVGKSTAQSIKIGERALRPRRDILVGALTEKQAYQVYFKALTYMQARYPKLIVMGKDKPTQHKFIIKNKEGVKNYSIVRSHALGLTGMGMRGFTITDLFIDECREIAREVFTALEPMLSITKGSRDYASTPGGRSGYFFDASQQPNMRVFHVSAEDCVRHTKEFLERQKASMTKVEYAQEYLGQFLDQVLRVFSDELIKECLILKRRGMKRAGKYYCGVDVARMGEDKSVIATLDGSNKEAMEQVENLITSRTLTTQTAKHILEQNETFNYRQIGIDGAGVGGGVFDQLLEERKTKYKIVDLVNATKALDADGKKAKRLLKEEMYVNLLRLMEHGHIKLLDDEEILKSFKSVLFAYNERNQMQIFGNDTHVVEAIIRAAWVAAKDKSLNLFATSSNHGLQRQIYY